MPCDPEGLITEGGETIATADGVVKHDAPAGEFGFVPHWLTCPFADKHRKDKNDGS
jgi:hypothetical protein